MKNIVFSILIMSIVAACPQKASTNTTASAPAVQELKLAASPSAAHVDKSTKPVLKSIVFIDKENACACTRKRADDSWAALQTALGNQAKIPVERIYLDSQAEKAEPYTSVKALMVVPGVYFVDANGSIIDMVQGELEETQLTQKMDELVPE